MADMTKETLIETADMICCNTFIFNHKWDMEVCKTPVTFDDDIKWNHIPFDDPEWTFMMNRHKFWTFLAKAYHLTKDKKYLDTFIRQINSWIDNVDIFSEEYKDCSRTIEMGLRCINWIKTLEIFEKDYTFDKEFKTKIFKSLKQQCDVLLEVYDDFRILSNWGVLQNCGLITFAFYYHLTDTDYFSIPLKRLKHQCAIQILPDGVHWEQSPMYQNEVLNCILEVAINFKKHKFSIPPFLKRTISKIGYSNMAMKKPSHTQPMQGDSDYTDLRDIITRCAAILKDGTLKSAGYSEIDFESIWELDEESIKNYPSIPTNYPKYPSMALEESGNFFLRNSFHEDGNYLWFNCGAIGSGHGHANLLHFDLNYHGEDFLIDSGRYTYVEENPVRVELKNCYAHNTTIVDDEMFSKFKGAWGIVEAALPLNNYYKFNKNFDYVEGAHLGYLNLPNPVIPMRKIFYLKPELWIIVDQFNTSGEHKYSQFFNLDDKITPTIENNSVTLQGKNTLFMKWSDKLDIDIKDIQISKEYNKLQPSKRITTNFLNSGATTIITVISPKDFELEKIQVRRGNDDLVEENESKAIKISLDNDEIIFFNSTKEINNQKKTYKLNDTLFYGKTAFFLNGKLRVLKY